MRNLQVRYSRLSSALIIGVYWAAWHVLLWVLTLNYLTPALLLIASINLVSCSVIFAFLYDRNFHSLPVVILLHAVLMTAQNYAFAVTSHRAIYIIPIEAALATGLGALFGKRLLDATPSVRWRNITHSELLIRDLL